MGIVYGSKYVAGRDIVETAQLVRADIKAAIASKLLPAGKYSVRIERYAGGQSLNVRMSDLALEAGLFNPEFLRREVGGHDDGTRQPRFSVEVRAAISMVESIVADYNYDGSDRQADYYNVNFYSNVDVGWEWANSLRTAETNALSAPAEASVHMAFLASLEVA